MKDANQIFDMGYFGQTHDSYGIVLFIDNANDSLHVLDISDPHNKKTVVIHSETFVKVRNLKDMSLEIESNHCENQATNVYTGNNFIAEVKVLPKRNVATLLLSAKQTYPYEVKSANPNHEEHRESIIRTLSSIADYDRECLKELERLIDSKFDYNQRIVTIKPSKTNQIFHITLSIIGKEIIVHNASIRYDNVPLFKQLKAVSEHPPINTHRELLVSA